MKNKFINKRKKKLFFKKIIIMLAVLFFFISLIFIITYKWVKDYNIISPVADFLNKEDDFEDKIKEFLDREKMSYSFLSFNNGAYIVKLQSGEEILFTSEKPLSSQISSLQLIYPRLKIEGKQFQKLDLRFDRPIILSK